MSGVEDQREGKRVRERDLKQVSSSAQRPVQGSDPTTLGS